MDYAIDQLEERGERPGHSVTFLRKDQLPKGKTGFGQIYIVFIAPSTIKGNHYHTKKHEWITCAEGEVKVTLKDRKNGTTEEIALSGEEKPLRRLYIQPGVAHAIENISSKRALVVEYSSEQFQPEADDFIKHHIK